MKTGWREATLGSVAKIVNGGTPDTKVSEYWDGGTAWLTPKDMGRATDDHVRNTSRTLSTAGLQNSSARTVPPESVILSTRAPIGHLAINTVSMAFNQGCRGLVPSGDLLARYLFFFLRANVGLLNELGTGTTFRELSAGALAAVTIPLPSLAEQQRIVDILDEAFEAISNATANATKNLVNVSRLTDRIASQAFEKVHRKLSMNELINEGTIQLGRGKVISKQDIIADPGRYPVYSSARENEGKFGEYGKYMFEEEIITWSLDGGGKLFYRPEHKFSVTNVGGTLRIFRTDLIDCRYLQKVLSFLHSRVRFDWVRKAHPSVIRNVYSEIPLPDIEGQRRILNELQSIDVEMIRVTALLTRKLTLLAELKQSLLARAFSGGLTDADALAA